MRPPRPPLCRSRRSEVGRNSLARPSRRNFLVEPSSKVIPLGLVVGLVAAARAADSPRVVVLDVPLLVQAGGDTICERLLHVECVEQVRQARIDARGWPAAQRDARERAWERGYRPPDPAKTLRVDASGDPTYTAENVGRIWNVLVGG